jgi:hypothetical protein
VLQLPPAPAVPTREVCQEYERLRKAINVLYMLQKKVQQKEAELAGLREHPGTDGRLAEGKVRTTCGRDRSWAVCFQGCKHGTETVSVAARMNLQSKPFQMRSLLYTDSLPTRLPALL